jgi:hypothetical protein
MTVILSGNTRAVDRIPNVSPTQGLAVHPTCGIDRVGEEEHTF